MMDESFIACRDALAGQEEVLSIEAVSTLLFQELLELEKHLYGGRRMRIVRSTDGAMVVSVHSIGEAKSAYTYRVRLKELRCMRQVFDEVTALYTALKQRNLVWGRKALSHDD